MTRMHTSDKGKSGSTNPVRESKPAWVDMSEERIESKIVELADRGKSPSEIGMVLRDQHGIPDIKQVLGRKVTEILEENDMAPEVPEDLMNLLEKSVSIQEHLEEHPKDTSARRGLQRTESKIRRLADYYKKEGKLGSDWRYDRDRASLLVK